MVQPSKEMLRLIDLGNRIKKVEDALAILGAPDSDVLEGHKTPPGLPHPPTAGTDRFRVLVWNDISPEYYARGLVDLDGRFNLSFISKLPAANEG